MSQAVLKRVQSVMHGTTIALDILADIRAHFGRGAVIEIIEQANAVPMEDRCQAFLRLVVLDAPTGGEIGPGITTAVSMVGGILERHGPEYTLALLSRIRSLPPARRGRELFEQAKMLEQGFGAIHRRVK
jgi:hypothetical protein